jgi:hypothetical protein
MILYFPTMLSIPAIRVEPVALTKTILFGTLAYLNNYLKVREAN